MAGDATVVIGSAVAAVAAGRVKLPLNLMQGYEVASVLEFPVRPLAVAGGRFHLGLISVAVSAEGAFVTGCTEPVIRCGIESVVLDKRAGVAEGIKRLHGALLLVFMTFGAAYLLPYGQCLGVRCRDAGNRFHLGAGSNYADKSGQCQEREQQFPGSHFFPPIKL